MKRLLGILSVAWLTTGCGVATSRENASRDAASREATTTSTISAQMMEGHDMAGNAGA
jgi:hypothetical protein